MKFQNMEENKKKALLEKISEAIHSDESPVGIDAKKTHLMILLELAEIREELKAIKLKMEN